MKRIISILLLFLPLLVAGQTLSVESFEMDLKDQTANNETTKQIDDNGEVCALIRIETTQKGFSYDGGTVGIVRADESKIGEIWLYVPAGLSHITIRHPQLGTLRDYYFPERLQAARTYVMKLVTGTVESVVRQKSSSQWLVLNYEPKEAMVEIDGELVNGNNGEFKKVLSYGKHEYRITYNDYHPEVGIFEVTAERKTIEVKLRPAFGWVEIKGPNGAAVFIDNKRVGIAPIKSDPISSGSHNLKIVKENWKSYSETVIVNDNTVTSVNPQLIANFATITLSTDGDTEVWVNDVKRGTGSVTLDLTPGEYTFETRKASHRSQSIVREITLSSGGTIDLPAPVAIVGSLSVDVNPTGAKIYLDGKYIGISPLILDEILIGQHKVKSVSQGLSDEEQMFSVKEGEMSCLMITMDKKLITTKKPGVNIKNGTLKSVSEKFSGDFMVGEDVVRIGYGAFNKCSNITSISICNNVEIIEEGAFARCTGLTNLLIPNSVESIGDYAFCGCANLINITISNSLTNIKKGTFLECSSLANFTVPDNVTSLGDSAFAKCNSLKNITLPNSILSMGKGVFSGCSHLKSIILSAGLSEIEDYSFHRCKGLTNIDIPENVTSVGCYAFCECDGLTNISIPDKVLSIGNYAFCGCVSLTDVIIPNNVISIGVGAFNGCTNLRNISIPNSVESIGSGAFIWCDKLVNIYVPKGSKKKIQKMIDMKLWDKVVEK